MQRLLAINGCYRKDSIIDQAIELTVAATTAAGATTDVAYLRDLPIGECLECSRCLGTKDNLPVDCIIRNQLHPLLERIDAADGFILASPANLYTATFVYKNFVQRLMAYAHRHGNHDSARVRRRHARKPAMLISSSASPGLIGRLYFSTRRQLKETARALGAKPAGLVFVGLETGAQDGILTDKSRQQLQALAHRLLHR